jgi:phosphoenolpyruvate carboxylase
MINKLVPDYQYYFEKQIVGPSLRIFARVPGIGTEEVALRTVFSNISNKVFQQRLQKMDAIAKYVDIIRECILCRKKSKKICCNECFKTRESEIDAQMEKEFSASTLKVRTCIDTCKKCLNQNEDEIHCENIHCDDYVPRKMSAVELAIVNENRRELMELKQSGKLEW